MGENDRAGAVSYHPNMPRKASPARTVGPDWFLAEWMDSRRITQADLCRMTGWSKATVNDIYHGRTEYYRAIVNQLANALHMDSWELLMHPAEANAIKSLRESALRIAAETHLPFTPAEPESDRLTPNRPGRSQRQGE